MYSKLKTITYKIQSEIGAYIGVTHGTSVCERACVCATWKWFILFINNNNKYIQIITHRSIDFHVRDVSVSACLTVCVTGNRWVSISQVLVPHNLHFNLIMPKQSHKHRSIRRRIASVAMTTIVEMCVRFYRFLNGFSTTTMKQSYVCTRGKFA